MHDWDIEFPNVLLRTDAGQHQQLRRVDRTATQNHLARRSGRAEPVVSAECHAGGPPSLEQDFLSHGPGYDAQIGPLHGRTQIADGARAALAVACRRLVIAGPVLAGAVEIVVARKAELG